MHRAVVAVAICRDVDRNNANHVSKSAKIFFPTVFLKLITLIL
jgi:Na+-transporting methylmalonyl-CoA/oxaloacetate decarboxylase beta subunit